MLTPEEQQELDSLNTLYAEPQAQNKLTDAEQAELTQLNTLYAEPQVQEVSQQPAFNPADKSTWVDNRDMTTQRTKMDDVRDLASGAYQGLSQGATIGFADELTGGFNATADALTALRNGDFGDFNFGDAYTQRRDESRQSLQDARDTTPFLTYPSEMLAGGGVLGGAMKKVATNPFRGGPKLTGNANVVMGQLAKKFDKAIPGNIVKQGALGGGAYSAGASDQSGLDLGIDTAQGALLGGVLPIVGRFAPEISAAGAGYASGYGIPLAATRAYAAKANRSLAQKTKQMSKEARAYSTALKKLRKDGAPQEEIDLLTRNYNQTKANFKKGKNPIERMARKYTEMETKALKKAKEVTSQQAGKSIPLVPYVTADKN